jgi:hypothetical protein
MSLAPEAAWVACRRSVEASVLWRLALASRRADRIPGGRGAECRVGRAYSRAGRRSGGGHDGAGGATRPAALRATRRPRP